MRHALMQCLAHHPLLVHTTEFVLRVPNGHCSHLMQHRMCLPVAACRHHVLSMPTCVSSHEPRACCPLLAAYQFRILGLCKRPLAKMPAANVRCSLLHALCLVPCAWRLMSYAYCLQLHAFCLLLRAFCLLPCAFCLLPHAHCLLLHA